MDIERKVIQADGFGIPCVMLRPPISHGAAVLVHGYGGCKEEQLGLAWRVAEVGITTCAIDHRGHGEHKLPLDENVPQDVEAAIAYCCGFGKVVAIGHSSGGRLSLTSSADFAIGISPALKTTYSAETERIITDLRSYRVRESFSGVNFEILKKLPTWQPIDNERLGGQQTTLTSSHDLTCKSSQLIDLTAGKLSVENGAPSSFAFATTARYADRSGSFFFR